MTVQAIQLRERGGARRLVRIAWDDASGELYGEPDVLARVREVAAVAVQVGDVPVDPIPCRVEVTDPFRDRVQLAAVLAQLFALPDDWRDALTAAVAAQGEDEPEDDDGDVVF